MVVSNLDYGVTSADVRGLFEEFGPLRTAAVRCDRSGGSRGTADVVYESEKPALEAMRRYHNARLDGRFMKIRPVTTDRRRWWSARGTVRTLRDGDGGARPARTVRNGKKMKPSFEDELDAQLDAYMKNRNDWLHCVVIFVTMIFLTYNHIDNHFLRLSFWKYPSTYIHTDIHRGR